MTPEEYNQLRVYARYDGIYLSVLWIAAFACVIALTLTPLMSTTAMLLMLSTPFFVAYRLRLFREEGLEGHISFRRALLYCFRVFFNAAIIFALAQWAYMEFLDNGHLQALVLSVFSSPEYQDLLQQMGFSVKEMTAAFSAITPLQFAMSYFVQNTFTGLALSILIAGLMKRK